MQYFYANCAKAYRKQVLFIMYLKIKLTLKPEFAEKIISELKEINFVYGLDSNIYWELVRKNSIKYWKELDRHEIFEIEIIN